MAAHLGLRCVLVQESWVDWPDAVYDRMGNIQRSRIMGALRPAGRGGLWHRLPPALNGYSALFR